MTNTNQRNRGNLSTRGTAKDTHKQAGSRPALGTTHEVALRAASHFSPPSTMHHILLFERHSSVVGSIYQQYRTYDQRRQLASLVRAYEFVVGKQAKKEYRMFLGDRYQL